MWYTWWIIIHHHRLLSADESQVGRNNCPLLGLWIPQSGDEQINTNT